MAPKRRSAQKSQKSTSLGRYDDHTNKIPPTDLSSSSQPLMSIVDSTSQYPPHPHPRPASDGSNFSFPSPFENNHPFEDDTPTSSIALADVLDTVDKKRKRSVSDAGFQLQLDTAFNGPPHDQRPDEITQPAVTNRMGITGNSTSDGPPPGKLSRKGESVAARFAQAMKDCGYTREVLQKLEDDIKESDRVNPPAPPKAPKPKKALRAKESSWADIPDWKGREDSPVLSLPPEVLDHCFGLRGDLFTRDYVALAGTCKFFRHYLNDDFFCELCEYKHIPRFRETPSIFDSPKPRTIPKIVHANNPFTRLLADWRFDPTIAGVSDSSDPQGGHGSGSGSSVMGHEEQLDRLMFKDKPGMGLRIQSGMGGCIYGVMAIVDGRKEGEVVVERDEEGMPLKDQTGVWILAKTKADAQTDSSDASKRGNANSGAQCTTASLGPYERLRTDRAIHDYWPSPWRRRAAEHVNSTRVNKFDAMRQYRVSEAQIITLRSYILPPSAQGNGIRYQQNYSRAAVEALAYRSQGGKEGYIARLRKYWERSDKFILSKIAKSKDKPQNPLDAAIDSLVVDAKVKTKMRTKRNEVEEWGVKDTHYPAFGCRCDECAAYQYIWWCG